MLTREASGDGLGVSGVRLQTLVCGGTMASPCWRSRELLPSVVVTAMMRGLTY
jgi:hypothetical protein